MSHCQICDPFDLIFKGHYNPYIVRLFREIKVRCATKVCVTKFLSISPYQSKTQTQTANPPNKIQITKPPNKTPNKPVISLVAVTYHNTKPTSKDTKDNPNLPFKLKQEVEKSR